MGTEGCTTNNSGQHNRYVHNIGVDIFIQNIGIKAGREVDQMTQLLEAQNEVIRNFTEVSVPRKIKQLTKTHLSMDRRQP